MAVAVGEKIYDCQPRKNLPELGKKNIWWRSSVLASDLEKKNVEQSEGETESLACCF